MPSRAVDSRVPRSDIADLCARAADAVTEIPGALSTVYVERGGRLRCQATRGYREVLDGISEGSGIVGRVFREGVPVVVADVSKSLDYVGIRTDIVAEVAVPVRCGRRLVGVVDCELTRPLTPDTVARVQAIGEALGRALDEAGGVPGESPAQRLTRHAAALTGLTKADEIEEAVLAGAVDISQMGSAMLLRLDDQGAVGARRALGPLAAELRALPARILRELARCASTGSSRYTVAPEARGRSLTPNPVTSVRTFLVLPIMGAHGAREVLLLADRRTKAITTDEIERLEMLCAHAGSALRVAELVRELRVQAATDPLTGLGHARTFHAKLRRLRGRPLAVLAIDLDGFKNVNDTLGHQAGDRLLREIASTLSATLRRGDELFRVGGDEFAALVRVNDAGEAMDAAARLVAAAARLGNVTVSVGVAIVDPDESVEAILGRADRALYEVKQSGRNAAALA